MLSDETIYQMVLSCVLEITEDPDTAEQILMESAKLDPNLSLYEDFGMQSLDLLDLMFKLEKKFKIKIDSKKLGLEKEGVFVEDILTESGAETLKNTLPEIKDKIEPGLYSNSILKLLTIQTFVNLIKKELIEEERI